MHLRILLAASLLWLAGEARAQQKVPDVDVFRATLAQDTNIADLRKRELALQPLNKKSTEAMLERGLILMRLYELRSVDRDISQARSDLERAADRAPADARFHYAYGLSNAVGHGVRIPSP